jgi:hypothetical protein
MTRSEFIQRLVLNEICDDFENVDQIILPQVAETGVKCGLTIARCEVVEALRSLVEAGLAKVYNLSVTQANPFSGELPGMPELAVPEEDFRTYFYLTKQGMEFHLADDAWWPLDDEGELCPGWKMPDW